MRSPARSRGVRAVAATLIIGVLTAVVIPLLAAPAMACSCVGWTEAESLEAADAAFTGRVESMTEPRSDIFGGLVGDAPVTATLLVDTVYKGSVPSRTEVTTAFDGAACGFAFEADRDYVVFAIVGGEGIVDVGPDELSTNLCSGTRVLDGQPPDLGEGAPPLVGGGAGSAGGGPGNVPYPAAGLIALGSVGALAACTGGLWARVGRLLRSPRTA